MSTHIMPQVGVPVMEEEKLQSSFLLQQSSDGSSAPAKKKRGLPGNPDPDAEVVALSPQTLLATNRYMCEVCHKGFQRDQNLQLHRRGHNLPWKLKQREGAPKKRVYVCPEVNCVHHDQSRALGDLTGIKKHYYRKHGEKKWKCDKCSKRYAVQSDWKAHSKICGTKEYRCDCGTIFARRDSFITHRAFCDALAEENNKLQQQQGLTAIEVTLENQSRQLGPPSIPTSNSISTTKASMNLSLSNQITNGPLHPTFPFQDNNILEVSQQATLQDSSFQLGGGCNSAGLSPLAYGSGFMSATALLQKAAAMGAIISDDSISPVLLRGFSGHVTSAKSCGLVQDPDRFWMNASTGSGFELGCIDSSPCSAVLQGGLLDSHPMMQQQNLDSVDLLEGVFMDRAQNDFDEGMTGEGGNRTVDFLGLCPGGHLTNKDQCFDDNMTDQLNLHGLQSYPTAANGATALEKSIWNF